VQFLINWAWRGVLEARDAYDLQARWATDQHHYLFIGGFNCLGYWARYYLIAVRAFIHIIPWR
jgi:hypothetical protein